MSVIYGYLQRDGKPVDPKILRQMGQAFGPWQADHDSVWHKESCGIGIRQNFETPQANDFPTPYLDPKTGSVFVVECRLDNRNELCRQLDIPSQEYETISDEKIIWLTYQKWGHASPSQLIGDWSFCVWNPKEQSLFLARDPYGVTAMNYYCDEHIFAFASNKLALLKLPQIPHKPNYTRIAQTFAFWRGDMSQTAHEGIFRLPPAHYLDISPTKFRQQRYFRLEDTPMLQLSSQEEASQGMLELYQKAVKAILRNPRGQALSLSSGLDSTSIAAIAAEQLKPLGQSLNAFCSVPAYTCPAHGDESPLVKELGAMWPNLDIEFIQDKATSPLSTSLDVIERLAEPIGQTYHYYWCDGFQKRARAKGLGCLINGTSGNLTISHRGSTRFLPFFELLKRGQATQAFYQQLTPYFVRRIRAWLQGTDSVYRSLSTEFMTSELLAKSQFMEQYRERKWLLENQISRKSTDLRLHHLAPQNDAMKHLIAEGANSYGMNAADPTLSLPLMQYCLGVPEQFYLSPTQDRALIRQAMRDRLPQSIIQQRKCNNQSLDIFPRLLKVDSEIRARLEQYKHSESVQAFVDVEFLIKKWDEYARLPAETLKFPYSISHFVRGMTCAHFIYTFF